MRVAVIGAGFAGLSAAVTLADAGVEVEIFEKEEVVGGLATGFKQKEWSWSLEYFYHHVFTNDKDILEMAKKVDWETKIYLPLTCSYLEGETLQLDSPLSVLRFNKISFFSRLHMGIGLGILKLIPNGTFLEKYKVVNFLPRLIGNEAYTRIWRKLLAAKFGSLMKEVNMAWFWSRVAKRTKNLGYFDGGFRTLAEKMADYIKKKGGVFHLNSKIDIKSAKFDGFDKVIITTPGPIADEIVGKKVMPKIEYLWAQTLVLELKRSLIKSYWLNILEEKWPFLVAVEHTRMINKKHYNGKTIVYLGNYFEPNNSQLSLDKSEVTKLYIKYLKELNPNFKKEWIVSSHLFRAPYAQPVFPVNYSEQLKNVPRQKGKFLFVNMSMVYPFDRGTNYAVKQGVDIAKYLLKK